MLTLEHQLAVLVVDRCPSRHLAGVAVGGHIDDLQLRVERVAGVDLSQELHQTPVKAMKTSPMYRGNRVAPGAVKASTCRP